MIDYVCGHERWWTAGGVYIYTLEGVFVVIAVRIYQVFQYLHITPLLINLLYHDVVSV